MGGCLLALDELHVDSLGLSLGQSLGTILTNRPAWGPNGDGSLDSATSIGSPAFPCWLKIEKSGITFVGYYSDDGSNWTEVGSVTVETANEIQDTGMFVCSVSSGNLSEARFETFDIS